ncbi:AbrB/MazE/SpoVT family DNA-binding domain-containing protein [Fundidesulfovibrio agrisoli]|uniref:AbrB/MazE/SpoVT family DNA-binding domain-containing protein n=1 Tax=Fundidesulfovibrio agrisoli TaxID=2922717 RepID=UPI001FAC99E8|nr:AbrB/MazE/SpoVT family DNA-binding domain-containing protein [Fundidesulfovibrio agrisoli]
MTMEVVLKRWGNSIGLRIPKGIADAAGFKADDAVSIDTSVDGLTIKKARRKYDLAELLSKVTPENRHDALDMGGQKGRELL